MIKKMPSIVSSLFVALIVLSGCGREGPPIRPSDAAIVQAKEYKLPPPESPVPNAENEDKKFILDKLLD